MCQVPHGPLAESLLGTEPLYRRSFELTLVWSGVSVRACARRGAAAFAVAVLIGVPSPVSAEPGARLWVARYNGPGDFLDVANDVAVSGDGATVFVAGLSDGRSGSSRYQLFWADYATVAYDAATGSPRWVRRYDGAARGWDSVNALALSPDGTRVYVTGGSRGFETGRDYATIAYDVTTGARLWVARYDGPAHLLDSARSVVVNADGSRVVVSGWSLRGFSPAGNRRNVYATVAYDTSTGDELWVSRTDLSGEVNYLWDSAVSPEGNTVVATGWGDAKGTPTAAETVAYDAATGSELWSVRADGVAAGYAAAVSPGGDTFFVSGSAPEGFGTIAYDGSTGQERWRATLAAPGEYGQAYDVVVSPDGLSVFVTGLAVWHERKSCSNDDYTTVAYEAETGEQQWVSRYDGPGRGSDWAQSIATSPDGSIVYVSGESAGLGSIFGCKRGEPKTGQDYATVAYDAMTGQQLWEDRYNSARQGKYDSAHSLAVGANGTVFVTGESHGGGYRDYATIAYSVT
jgi:outer membrane protein assembly factor BamB